MIKGMARLTTGGDVAKVGITLLVGLGLMAIVAAGMQAGSGRICVECILGAVIVAVAFRTWLGVFRRYQQLAAGKCPNPLCHGVVQHSDLVGRGKVVCPTCKKTWPELERMQFRATARS